MMQEIELYDPGRRPPEWTGLVHPGQYVVFHSDVGTNIEKTADGRYLGPGDKSTCRVFDSLAEAEAYCEAKVEELSRLRCDIYDHTGKSKPPIVTYVNQAHLKSPQKHARWGWVLLAASLPCFWMAWQGGGGLVLPLILGLNLVFAGLRLIYWGYGGAEKRRSTRER